MFAHDDPDGWDTYLPYLLFVYRDVPQSSTGFSPVQLIYSHVVRAPPLDFLRDRLDSSEAQEQNLIHYVLKIREKMNNMMGVAQEHLSREKSKQKEWYDKQSRKLIWNFSQTRPTHWRTNANLYPPERQLIKASEPSFDLEGGSQGQILPHQKISSP